jgi:hypothetical protein
VSRIEFDVLNSTYSFMWPHELIPACPDILYHSKAFLRVNHYIGNWEYYSFRKNDGRAGALKNRARWSRESSLKGGRSGDEIRPWIAGFVRHMGEEEELRLLDNCGLHLDYVSPIEKEWLRPEERSNIIKAIARMNKALLKQRNLNKEAMRVCDGWSEWPILPRHSNRKVFRTFASVTEIQ